MSNEKHFHQAVLKNEVQELLAPQAGEYFVDGTFGRGGHSAALLAAGARVIAFDFDQEAIKAAQENFASEIAKGQLQLFRENFVQMADVIENLRKSENFEISGILFDFGTSTDQLMSEERGFSFQTEKAEILDMRMDQRLGVRAADLLRLLDEKQLAGMLSEFGGESSAKAIAKAVVEQRRRKPASLDYSDTLLRIIEKVKGPRKKGHLHPATKTFQALRIVVNNELDNIAQVLPLAFQLLNESKAQQRRLVCISFHEGEDRLVKSFFKEVSDRGQAQLLTKKAVFATDAEIAENHRARSARLRALAL
jgi:16S rRNA (cytosine1402-N4)-methyltransferase